MLWQCQDVIPLHVYQAWGDYMSNVIDYDYDYLLAV